MVTKREGIDKWIISEETLRSVENKTLFYPASAKDIQICIDIFSPYVTDFFFVDLSYFREISEHKRPVINHPDYVMISRHTKGLLKARIEERYDSNCIRYPYIEPCTVTEKYFHIPSRKIIKVRKKRGFAEYTFDNEISELGVFFARGDSGNGGDGGTGITWWDKKRFKAISDKLCDGGLICTDGSNYGCKKTKEIWKNVWSRDTNYNPEELIKTYNPITDTQGRTFSCVGYAGHRYGPTIIFQMRNPIRTEDNQNTPLL